MVQFNEEKEEKKFDQLREQEEEDLMQLLAPRYNAQYIDLSVVPINTDALGIVSEEKARKAYIALFNKNGKKLDVAFHGPPQEVTDLALRELEDRGYTIVRHLASMKSLETAWERYKDMSFASESSRGLLDVSSEEISTFLSEVHDVEGVKKHIKQTLSMKKAYRISRIVEVFIAGALATHSSDIHIEPEEKQVRIRMRLDGILADIATLTHETYHLVLSRIKLLSGLKLNVQSEAQDGRFSIKLEKSSIEIRTSLLPGAYGESIVMRILNPDAISVSIEALGMDPDLMKVVEREINKPNGLVLTTGPTGSGKTTTLYAFIKQVHVPGIKILTIEDPIEYHLNGIVQTQVENDSDYTFSSGLRAAMRQDPDVIMVGEIRDSETAEIAMHAALTGHIVFTTLHTNSAAGAFPRLADLGVNPSIMGSGINIALAQRLVRKLCSECKKEIPVEGEQKETIDAVLQSIYRKEKVEGVQTDHMWVAGSGCDVCGGDGYKGRVGIYEAVVVDEAIESILRMNPSEREIMKEARPQGILTMAQDSVLKVLKGTTSIEEVLRVVSLDVSTTHPEEPEASLDSFSPETNSLKDINSFSFDETLPPLDPLSPVDSLPPLGKDDTDL